MKIVPKFIYRCNVTCLYFKYLSNFCLSLLRVVIQDTRRRLSVIEKELYYLHLKLSYVSGDFSLYEHKFYRSAHQHRIKLDFSITDLSSVNKKAVAKLSRLELSNKQIEILDRNRNFFVSCKPCVPDSIALVEKVFKLSSLSASQTNSARHHIANTVNFNFSLASNLNKTDKLCFRDLPSNPNAIIIRTDKGGEIVVSDRSLYIEKVNSLLNEVPCCPITEDPSSNE